jgi:predicted amidohydrolase
MMEKFFFHRIKAEGEAFSKGIEIHDSLDSAIRAFYGYWTYAYNNPSSPNVTFVSCRVTDGSGAVVGKYDMTWLKDAGMANKFFMHYIRHDGDSFAKNIDIFDSFDAAKGAFGAQMAYGYENPNHANVDFVSCQITDMYGATCEPYNDTWNKPEPEPEE